ncbi:hypothetical protein CCR75_009026 [Bremia lactucae]|uniref:Uncharacterized protein n=1 Tax=Bremia lactucae TaxID=4779 RepID=A0A976IBC1_BRELC|nr:hypothetical protein CCR75_009026 [Bremia lactucae]
MRRSSRVTVDQLLCEALARVDTYMDGKVNAINIQRWLRGVGLNLLREVVGKLMKHLVTTNQGKLTYKDYHALHDAIIVWDLSLIYTIKKGYLAAWTCSMDCRRWVSP